MILKLTDFSFLNIKGPIAESINSIEVHEVKKYKLSKQKIKEFEDRIKDLTFKCNELFERKEGLYELLDKNGVCYTESKKQLNSIKFWSRGRRKIVNTLEQRIAATQYAEGLYGLEDAHLNNKIKELGEEIRSILKNTSILHHFEKDTITKHNYMVALNNLPDKIINNISLIEETEDYYLVYNSNSSLIHLFFLEEVISYRVTLNFKEGDTPFTPNKHFNSTEEASKFVNDNFGYVVLNYGVYK